MCRSGKLKHETSASARTWRQRNRPVQPPHHILHNTEAEARAVLFLCRVERIEDTLTILFAYSRTGVANREKNVPPFAPGSISLGVPEKDRREPAQDPSRTVYSRRRSFREGGRFPLPDTTRRLG